MRIDNNQVSLREITSATVRAVIDLSVAENQKGFVAPNAVSLAQALFAPEAWYRAIYLADEPVGFLMLEDESLATPVPEDPGIAVWRFMIDQKFQRRGIGRAALQLIIEHARNKRLFRTLQLSYVPGPGCPEPFYLGMGFRHTGRVDGREVVLEFPLAQNSNVAENSHSDPDTPQIPTMDIDTGKIDDAVLALLYLTLHDGARAWKGHDWDALDRLHEKGLISSPASKAKSVVLSERGLAESRRLFEELFVRRDDRKTGR